MASSLPSADGSSLALPLQPSPLRFPRPPRFLREEEEDELSEDQEALLPRASQAAAATPAGITAEGGSGAAAGAAAAVAGTKALPFCIAIAVVLLVVVVLGVITFAARYYVRIHLRRARRATNEADSVATAGAGGSQAPGDGLDAERIAAFPTWPYCVFPAVAEDVSADKGNYDDKEIAIFADAGNLLRKSDSQESEFLKRRSLLTSTECTVCLSDFNEGELVRSVLP
ncbi:unnamed protein product [Closterium sp. Yama58-4]|nr:unnamed protein product [Closterium sp. Yama58-4]